MSWEDDIKKKVDYASTTGFRNASQVFESRARKMFKLNDNIRNTEFSSNSIKEAKDFLKELEFARENLEHYLESLDR
tara:strand:+ start:80 stop:310 length:231 start_codon:yes stop_codon:yes gene_type:complete